MSDLDQDSIDEVVQRTWKSPNLTGEASRLPLTIAATSGVAISAPVHRIRIYASSSAFPSTLTSTSTWSLSTVAFEFGFGGSVEIQSPPRIAVALTDGSNFLTR